MATIPKDLTTRDIEILRYLMESKLLTRDQIKNKFFNNCDSVRVVNRRLRRCIDHGLIYKKAVVVGYRFHFHYFITPKGLVFVQKFIPELIKKPQLSEKPDHDLMLVDIRQKLEKFSIVKNFFSENALQSYKWIKQNSNYESFIKLNSDACIELDIGFSTELLVLEYENSSQSSAFYEKRIKRIYQSSILKCIVISRTESCISKMQEHERQLLYETKVKTKIYYSLLKDFQEAKERIIFYDQFGEEFILS